MTKIEAKSLVDAATERLEAAIIGGELSPGDRVREQVLAEEYGISQALEGMACRLATERISPNELAKLRAMLGPVLAASGGS